MSGSVTKLTVADSDAVDALMRDNSRTLGFLPMEALRDYLEKGTVLGIKLESGKLIGYLLYAAYADRFRIVHLCVSEDFQGQGNARRLFKSLKSETTTQNRIVLNCRNDFPANDMWDKLGFIPLSEKPGRSMDGSPLTHWEFLLSKRNQLDLFQFEAQESYDSINVVIDAQVFFDFDDCSRPGAKQSRALFSDYLVDTINPWITDEIYVEINRNQDDRQRENSRRKAREFNGVQHDPELSRYFEGSLIEILPDNTERDKSDIRQLAKTAASNVKVFVTRDENILKKSDEIEGLLKIQVVSPIKLLLQHDEINNKQSYANFRVSGLGLSWRRLNADDLETFHYSSFLEPDETKGKFRENLASLVANVKYNTCELLWSKGDVVAIRVVNTGSDRILAVPFSRVSRSGERSFFQRFLIADTMDKAVEKDVDVVRFDMLAVSPDMESDLLEMKFIRCNDGFVRFCISKCFADRNEALSIISDTCPDSLSYYQTMSDTDLEDHCSPLSLMANDNIFLVPIRPGYALSLIDIRQSGNDMFGGDPNVLLRWDNVYYRKATRRRMLKSPGRILWYVSGDQGKIVAISRLDKVVIGSPRELLRQFKPLGVLDWKGLYEMCDGNISSELMALRFSHTFPFREGIPLSRIRKVFQTASIEPIFQSPSRVPMRVFNKLYTLGYPDRG